ncbi:hypothetical protein F7725_004173 [Dissostichus mawsoni]|uniref:Uncharacterized protein n=1 Tax=Dissostichus mawsoni TaxID=36200 RepID=A0A7J5XJE2_DISMA|nr:hypothetical protein F7725_004173 [Dissostichus mawsoni]
MALRLRTIMQSRQLRRCKQAPATWTHSSRVLYTETLTELWEEGETHERKALAASSNPDIITQLTPSSGSQPCQADSCESVLELQQQHRI